MNLSLSLTQSLVHMLCFSVDPVDVSDPSLSPSISLPFPSPSQFLWSQLVSRAPSLCPHLRVARGERGISRRRGMNRGEEGSYKLG